MHKAQLAERIRKLAPWHLDVEIVPGLSTALANDSELSSGRAELGEVSFISPRSGFRSMIKKIFPEGLEGKSFLDCACNCGGYSFWARELGATRCFGFDVRGHWIKQAEFLHGARNEGDNIRFEIVDLYDLPKLNLPLFDVTLFKGIFYHLPDPITGLKAAADLTREVLILNTAARADLPDGMLAVGYEGREALMSGVYGLNWFPTGPRVLRDVLTWLGFAETRLVHTSQAQERQGRQSSRITVVAARSGGYLDEFEEI